MNICFITTGLDYGGAEKQLLDLAIRIKNKGHSVNIISMLKPVAFLDILGENGIAVHSLDMTRGKGRFIDLIRTIKILRKLKPDVIHAHMVHANFLSRLSVKFCGNKNVRLVCTAHNTVEGGKVIDMVYRLTDGLSDLNTQVSQDGLDRYLKDKVFPVESKSIFLRNGIDLKKFTKSASDRESLRKELGIKDSSFVWLAVGRLEEQKNYSLMLRAFKKHLERAPNSILLIAGKGVLEESLKQEANELALDENVMFLGLRTDVVKLMSSSDAYLMSSLWEGMPIVILEAAAMELPIVSTNVGGIEEVVGNYSWLVESNSVENLALAMEEVINNKDELYTKMSDMRLHIVEQFDIDSVVDRWIELYKGKVTK